MVWPWAGNMSPHTQFQEGLELSRQVLKPPEWPSLPAKEHLPHTSNLETPRSRPRRLSPEHGLRTGGRSGWGEVGLACS